MCVPTGIFGSEAASMPVVDPDAAFLSGSQRGRSHLDVVEFGRPTSWDMESLGKQMMCSGCSRDLTVSEFPTLLKGGRSTKCWKCTDWRLHRRAKDCPSCEAQGSVTESMETYEFAYGLDGPGQVQIQVTHPILHCAKCDEDFSDVRGEEARDLAVKTHLALLVGSDAPAA